MHPLYENDLLQACEGLGDLQPLRGSRVLITGVTGLVGACLADASLLTILVCHASYFLGTNSLFIETG
jgi:hypothetical protein